MATWSPPYYANHVMQLSLSLGNCIMDLILDLLDLPQIFFLLSSLSPLFPYLLSPGVRTSPWPLRTQRPGETWMTPTPHPLWAPRDRPVGDTSPRVETTPVNWVRASADLLRPLLISKLRLSCDLFRRHGQCCLVTWGSSLKKVYILASPSHFILIALIKMNNPSWIKTAPASIYYLCDPNIHQPSEIC